IYHQHDRGVDVCFDAPVITNKLSVFLSYEGVRQANTVVSRGVQQQTAAFEQYVVSVNPSSIAANIFSTPGIAPRISTTISQTDCCSLITNPSDPNFHPLGTWYQHGPGAGNATGNGPDLIPDWGVFHLPKPNPT